MLQHPKDVINIDALNRLRDREEQLVKKIRAKIIEKIEIEKKGKKQKSKFQMVYLPNLTPKKKVDYIFIGREPSFEWASNEKDAEKKKKQGFRNFIYSYNDFILHYCIKTYLSDSYYITDFFQGAMSISIAKKWRKFIDENTFYKKCLITLLNEEIEIVGNPNCKLIYIGRSELNWQEEFEKTLNIKPKRILHPAARNGVNKIPNGHPDDFQAFNKNICFEMILQFAETFLNNISKTYWDEISAHIRKWILDNLILTETRRKLMFTYKIRFQEVKKNKN